MQRVERQIVTKDKNIDHLCWLSKNLYNYCNFILRQVYFSKLEAISEYSDLIKTLTIKDKGYYKIDEYDLSKRLVKLKQPDYYALPAQTSQQVIKLLYKNWKSFFKSIKERSKNKEKFLGVPKMPGYKDKTKGRNIVVFTNQQVQVKGGVIKFPEKTNLEPIKTKVAKVVQVRIVPQATCFVIEIVYNKEVQNVPLKKDTYLGIDIGVNNLAACVNNIGEKPFVINGRPLKSINQYFNKLKALYQSFVGDKSSRRIKRCVLKRTNKVDDFLHKASRFIVEYCKEKGIETIVIVKNPNWKQEVNNGKANNQNFVSIPFDRFIKQITYKAEEYGIKVITNEESYTSKCSFLDLEELCHQSVYLGRRFKRGLFRSAKKIIINADLQGGYNILRKVAANINFKEFIKVVEGVGLHPVLVNIK